MTGPLQPEYALWKASNCLCYQPALLLPHTPLQHKYVSNFTGKSLLEILQMFGPGCKKQG